MIVVCGWLLKKPSSVSMKTLNKTFATLLFFPAFIVCLVSLYVSGMHKNVLYLVSKSSFHIVYVNKITSEEILHL